MAFKDIVRDVIDNFGRNTGWFGETVSYTPVGGTARNVDVYVEFEEEIGLEGDSTETRTVLLKITCKRNATEGIDLPNIGDKIVRTVPNDRDARPYVWHGEIDNEGRDHWRLTFRRKRLDARGFGR